MGRPPIGKRAMTDAERQRRRRQRLAAEQPWDVREEAKRIKLRLVSRGLGEMEAQSLAAALGVNVTSRVTKHARQTVTSSVTKHARQTVTSSVTKLQDIHKAYAQAVEELPAHYEKLPKWEKLPRELRETIIGVYHIGNAAGAAGR